MITTDELFDEIQDLRKELVQVQIEIRAFEKRAQARVKALETGLHEAYPHVVHTAAVERGTNRGHLASEVLTIMRELLAAEGKPL